MMRTKQVDPNASQESQRTMSMMDEKLARWVVDLALARFSAPMCLLKAFSDVIAWLDLFLVSWNGFPLQPNSH